MKPVIPLLSIVLALSAVGVSAEKARPLTLPPSLVMPFESAALELNRYAALQKQLKLQDAHLALAMRKALVMADLLVKGDGTLDLASCSLAKSTFLPREPQEYEINMGKVLDTLSDSWQGVFSKVHLPKNDTSLLALRALFSLSPSQPLTNRHAKVALLASMLAPFNQGPVGDCFAVSVVIRDHKEYFLHAAVDYSSIVMNGHIDRPVNGKTDAFFFLPTLADEDRNQSFNLSSDGTFPNTKLNLFDAPGFAAARSLMGGDETLGLADCLRLLSQYVQDSQITATPAQVIAAMALCLAAKTPERDASQLAGIGNYAFSSLTNNPILRGTESAFAAMAEDRQNDSTRSNINSCIAQSLESTWETLSSMQGAAAFQQALMQNFDASYRLLYNLDIPLAQVSSDGSSTDGGFQLYRRVAGNNELLGTRVATPQELRQLVLDAIASTARALGLTSDAQAINNALVSVVQTDDFIKNALWAYDQANQQEPDPVGNYQKLKRTPMQSCDGDNPYEVSDIDTGVTYDMNVQSYTPGNAKDLITWCLTLAKSAPSELIPMDSPQHAFNFVPANPDIAAFLKMGMPIGKWIQNRLVVPGIGVSRKKIDATTLQAIADAAHDQIADALKDDQAYQTLVQNLLQQNLSVKDFAASLLTGINNLLGANAEEAHAVALMLDAALLQHLSTNDKAILSQSAVRFAFTNWNEGTDDIYFCAYFNPRTEQVGFGTIFENKSHLQPMDEDAWVNHQQWDVDLMPAAPIAE